MSIKTELNRAKALAHIYRYFGRNIKKLPRWLAGKATVSEIDNWNRLQHTLKEKFGLSAREIKSVVNKASKEK